MAWQVVGESRELQAAFLRCPGCFVVLALFKGADVYESPPNACPACKQVNKED